MTKMTVDDSDLQKARRAMISSARKHGRTLDSHVDDLRAAIEAFLDNRGLLAKKSDDWVIE